MEGMALALVPPAVAWVAQLLYVGVLAGMAAVALASLNPKRGDLYAVAAGGAAGGGVQW
jgi:hypothetical protein